ncbi:MAG: hypothetical protein KF718_22490 [Polyangiaceae bacterium]|nr:hypothetical protein [Polyangiaceae bacterium]
MPRPFAHVCSAAVACGGLALGCEPSLVEPGEMIVVLGDADDPLLSAARTRVLKHAETGEPTLVLDRAGPVRRFSLGRGGAGAFELRADDATDALGAWGRSIPIDPAGVAGLSLPLFVSKTGAFSHAPDGALPAVAGAVAGVVANRYLTVLVPGGDRVRAHAYDLGFWRSAGAPIAISCPSEPCAFRSLAIVGRVAIAIGEDFAIWFDLLDGTSGDVTRPDALPSWSSIAGGRTIDGDGGARVIVGPTRDAPSEWALLISADLALSALRLTAPRARAAATWPRDRGLLVAGGSDTAAGLELVPVGATSATPLGYPPDPVRGAALVEIGDAVWRVGGQLAGGAAPTVELALACGTSCSPVPISEPVALDAAHAFALHPAALVVGLDASGVTRARRVSTTGVEELPLAEDRHDALALLLPTGHVGVFGGTRASGSPDPLVLQLFGR